MRNRLISVLICFAALALNAGEVTSISKEEATTIARELKGFEQGTVSFEELSDNASRRGCERLVAYYLAHTNEVSTKAKLPISRCLGGLGRFSDAGRLAADYVKVYPDDSNGWRVLGSANFGNKSFTNALAAYTNAVMRGDEASYGPLAFSALMTDRLDIVRDIVPHLMILKRAERTGDKDKLEMTMALVIYSFKTDQTNVFIRALEGVTVKQVLSREDLTTVVSEACEKFPVKEAAEICEAAREAIKSEERPRTDSPKP